MAAPRAAAALLCAAALLAAARRSSLEQEDGQEEVRSARCTSRCLTLHMTQLTSAFRHLQSDNVLVWCENHRRCAQCLLPCKDLWETRKVPSRSCEKQTECVASRDFLTSLGASRQGDCPPPRRAAGFAAACVESCSSDRHCPAPRKCCSNGCGHTCQAAANLYKGVPLKPRREMSVLEDSEGGVKVAWESKFNVSVEPVVYVLQSRWNLGIHPSEDHASPWASVAMTLSEDVVLSDLRPQRWYQFRVAAMNSHGSRGFTTPSRHHMSSQDPTPPEPPAGLRVSNQTLDRAAPLGDSGVTVAALLRWEPPRDGDLPVHHYRVTWMSRHAADTHAHTHAHAHAHALHTHPHAAHNNVHTRPTHTRTPEHSGKKESNSRVTGGAQSQLWLAALLPATSYFLSVQTVAYWGQKRLKSPRAQLVFTTRTLTGEDFSNELPWSSSSSSSLLSSSPVLPLSSSPPPPEAPLNPIAPGRLRLEVAAPHRHDDQLQAKVFWKWSHLGRQRLPGPYLLRWRPHTCSMNSTGTEETTTLQRTHHTITGLLFSCKYRVSVMMEADQGSEVVAWFTTPTCSSVRVRGGRALSCGPEERPLAGRKVVLRPERLSAEFRLLNGSVLMILRWRISHHAPGLAAVEGFRFTWTLQPTGDRGGPGDTPPSQTQSIAPSRRSVAVSGLQADRVYQLQLQLLPAGGVSGAAVSKTVRTPRFEAQSPQPSPPAAPSSSSPSSSSPSSSSPSSSSPSSSSPSSSS